MKLGLIFSGLVLCCATGCAANPALQAQVTSLQQESARQNAQIEDLSARAAKCAANHAERTLSNDASDLATAAWSWLSSEADDASKYGNSIYACYRAGAKEGQSFQDAQNLMARCYNAAQQH